LKERIEKSKEKRLLNSKVEGNALSAVDAPEQELLSTSEWVKRSRLKELDKKEKDKIAAELAAKRLQEDEESIVQSAYTSSDLKGLAIKHSGKDFDAGDVVILTLADSNVLAKDDRGRVLGVNEDMDVLENVNMTEHEKRLEREKIKKRAQLPAYLAYDDAEFEEGASFGSKPSILSQYDKEKKTGPKTLLGEGGVVVGNTSIFTGAITSSDNDKKPLVQSLIVDSNKIASDYMTSSEAAAVFHKPKSTKQKKLRKKTSATSSAGLIEELEASNAMDIARDSDRGSRQSVVPGANSAKILLEENKKRESYNLAVRSAEDRSARLLESSTSNDIDEDDVDVAAAVERARRLAQKSTSSQSIADRVLQSKQLESKLTGKSISDAEVLADKNAVNAEGRTADGKLVFTSTTEFTTRLQAQLNEKNRAKAEAAVREMDIYSQAGRKHHGEGAIESSTDQKEDEYSDSDLVHVGSEMDVENSDQESHEDDQLGFVHRQPTFGGGVSSALMLLKQSGDLRQKEELAGRARDERSLDPSATDFGVKLEYRDEFGRKLTQKEAYRQISYRFHGFGPGRKKMEKRLKVVKVVFVLNHVFVILNF
jgi:U4/U6.U5 tri-snRNP-associated protein 1